MKSPTIAVLSSGEGTTVDAFVRTSIQSPDSPEVKLVICSNKKAGIFVRVDALNTELNLQIKTLLINSKTHPAEPDEEARPGEQTKAEEAAIQNVLEDEKVDLITLMGYMKKIGPRLVHEFGWQPEYTDPRQAMMVNTHPGLLPETKGLYGVHVQEHVLQKGLPHSGQTLHVVAEDYDDGPTIAEHKVAVRPDDTPESLFDRVRETEKNHLPGDIAQFIQDRKQFLEGQT